MPEEQTVREKAAGLVRGAGKGWWVQPVTDWAANVIEGKEKEQK